MHRIAAFFRTIFTGIAEALSALGHALIVIVTAPFRALANLFGGGRSGRRSRRRSI